MQDKRIDALLQMLAQKNMENETGARKKMENSLNSEQKNLFHQAMNDPSVANQLLNTPQAKELLKKLQNGGGKNGTQ